MLKCLYIYLYMFITTRFTNISMILTYDLILLSYDLFIPGALAIFLRFDCLSFRTVNSV